MVSFDSRHQHLAVSVFRKIAAAKRARDLHESNESTTSTSLKECLGDFQYVEELREAQKTCLVNLARGGDLFAILPTGFGKSLIFQRLAKAALNSEKSTIIIVSPLVSVMLLLVFFSTINSEIFTERG